MLDRGVLIIRGFMTMEKCEFVEYPSVSSLLMERNKEEERPCVGYR